jgi:NAD(P) transhydrogenase subunit alpha
VSETPDQAPAQGPRLSVLAVAETAPGENRVAIVPESVPRLQKLGLDVLIEAGAGAGAGLPAES